METRIRTRAPWLIALALTGAARVDAQTSPSCDGPAVAGRVTDESGQIPLPGATVIVQWGDVLRRPSRSASRPDGTYRLCAARDAVEAIVWAEFGDYSSQQHRLSLADDQVGDVALRIALASEPAARILGRIRDIETEEGIPAAAIELVDGHTAAMTGSGGDFVLTGVPPGRYRLRVRHLGYAEISEEVEAQSGRTLEIQIGLTRQPLTVAPLVVTAIRSRKLEIHGFYERKFWGERLGLGKFYTQRDIERRMPLRISHMIADAPGIRVTCPGSGIRSCRVVSTRTGCNLNAYIDGVSLRLDRRASLDEFILPIEIGGIEVYPGVAGLPAEFAGSDARCGAVVIWTR